MNKQRKVLITITYNEMGIIIDTKAEEVAQPEVETQMSLADCIRREDAIEAVEALAYHADKYVMDSDVHEVHGFRTGLAVAERQLELVLTAEPPERKTGKWINANDGKWNTVEVLKCSVCGEMDNRMHKTDNFCPNCGSYNGGDTDD